MNYFELHSKKKKSSQEIQNYILNRIRKHENHTKTHTHSTNTYHYHFPKHLSIFVQQHRKKNLGSEHLIFWQTPQAIHRQHSERERKIYLH